MATSLPNSVTWVLALNSVFTEHDALALDQKAQLSSDQLPHRLRIFFRNLLITTFTFVFALTVVNQCTSLSQCPDDRILQQLLPHVRS